MEQLAADSRRHGTQGEELDLALLLDGLAAEREQGITIDVAYRYFSTSTRKFIVADTPGHEQYTRNMVTGAATAELAVLLVDARKGLLPQTRRHAFLATLVGVQHLVLVVNKMDLVAFDAGAFTAIEAQAHALAADLDGPSLTCIPVSALRGDNVVQRAATMPWYEGPSLLEYLQRVRVDERADGAAFRMPLQWVNRHATDFRGYAGQIASGSVRRGDIVAVQPSGVTSAVARIVTADGELEEARAGQSVTLTLASDVDASRGDLLTLAADRADVAHAVEAAIVWMHEEPLRAGHAYALRIGTRWLNATVATLDSRIELERFERHPATQLDMNDIGFCRLEFDRPVALDTYVENRHTGGFILVDRSTHETVGAGTVRSAIRGTRNLYWLRHAVDREARASSKLQTPRVLWFTGLSGAGKSTIANRVEQRLHALGRHTYLLDGDNLRHGLCHDLGFSAIDRAENVRRVAEVARLMLDAGLIVIVSLISPFRADRELARERIGADDFLEIHVDAPLPVAEARDPKGLYARARRGELPAFTGVDSPYEPPHAPQLHLDTTQLTAEAAADRVVAALH